MLNFRKIQSQKQQFNLNPNIVLQTKSNNDAVSMQCRLKIGQIRINLVKNMGSITCFSLLWLQPAGEAALSLSPEESIIFPRKLMDIHRIFPSLERTSFKALMLQMKNALRSDVTLKVLVSAHPSPCLLWQCDHFCCCWFPRCKQSTWFNAPWLPLTVMSRQGATSALLNCV